MSEESVDVLMAIWGYYRQDRTAPMDGPGNNKEAA